MKRLVSLVAVLLLLPSLLLAQSAVLGPAANPLSPTVYDYRNTAEWYEEFGSGANTAGTIANNGWNISGGTTNNVSGEASHPGILRKTTSASSGTTSYLGFNTFNSGPLSLSSVTTAVRWVTRLNTNDANTTVRMGLAVSGTSSPPTGGSYMEKLDGDTNWFCVTRASGSQTRTDSGVAVSTGWVTFYVTHTGTLVTFQVNHVPVCSHATNIYTSIAEPFMHIINSAAADKTIDIDYVHVKQTGLSR